MTSVTALEAKENFTAVLDRMAKGEEFLIFRHDRPVARMVPEVIPSLVETRQVVHELRELQRRIHQRSGGIDLTAEEVRTAINEGRL